MDDPLKLKCRSCHRTFNKGEHLRRHERCHTGSKPFQCIHCLRSFSRQDSLARHYKLHTRSGHATSNEFETNNTHDKNKPVTPESIDSASLHLDNDSVHLRAADHGQRLLNDASRLENDPPPIPQVAADLDFDLIWPDSENLFQTIICPDITDQWQLPLGTLPFSASPGPSEIAFGTPRSFDERPSSIGMIPSGGNTQAVHDVSKMISNLSSSVTAAAKCNSITSVFLDECLHMFFVKFIPTFPILHRATFVFRDCARTLLLNAIAIGSLYLGPKDAVAKGEALWHLAHTAIATSWQNLITHRGQYDACEGVQLLLAAVLSQLYGALSGNRAIRTTSHSFHSLGFTWARRCGMFESEPFDLSTIPSCSASESEKDHQWRTWVAREIQQRALLAHYMLDGLISQMSGEPTSIRHATNQLLLPSTEAAFEANTADEWISCMQSSSPKNAISFRTILRQLFRPAGEIRWQDASLSAFSYKVILEALQSLISDDDTEETAVGVPTRGEVRRALNQVYESINLNVSLTTADRLETMLRWHSICIDTIVDSSGLCRILCSDHDIDQHIWRNAQRPKSSVDLANWATTPAARTALLHAMTIQEIVEQLPRGRAHTINMPSALFSAATIYSVFALAGQAVHKIPCTVVWQDALAETAQSKHSPYLALSELSNPASTSNSETDTSRYIRGDVLYGSSGTSRNIVYELNSIQKLFRCLCAQWGVAYDMESIVEQWIELCH